MGLLVFIVVPVLAAAVSLGFGVAWLAAPQSRATIVRRYPLPLMTWAIATVPTALAGLALFLVAAWSFESSETFYPGAGPGRVSLLVERFAAPAVALLVVVLGIMVIVTSHLRPR